MLAFKTIYEIITILVIIGLFFYGLYVYGGFESVMIALGFIIVIAVIVGWYHLGEHLNAFSLFAASG